MDSTYTLIIKTLKKSRCPTCHGTGRLDPSRSHSDHPCKVCQGSGFDPSLIEMDPSKLINDFSFLTDRL